MTQTIETPAQAITQVNAAPIQQRPSQTGNRGIVPSNFEELWRLSVAFSKSGLAPKGIQSPEAIFTAVQLGLELGLSPMSALQSIAVVNGRPSIYGDAALALVRGSGLCEFYTEFPSNTAIHALAEMLAVALEYGEVDEVKKTRRQIAELSVKMDRNADDFGYTSISKRMGGVNAVVRRFTISDAKKASLFGKQGPWKEYTERMLMWRSRGFNLRDNFGDVLRGMYTAEEAQDIGGSQSIVSQIPPASRPQALLEKITNRPVSEGQTFVPEQQAIDMATGELRDEASQQLQSHDFAVTQPVGQADRVTHEPGKEPTDSAIALETESTEHMGKAAARRIMLKEMCDQDWQHFLDSWNGMMAGKVDPKVMASGLRLMCKSVPVVLEETANAHAKRLAWVEASLENRINWEKGLVMPAKQEQA